MQIISFWFVFLFLVISLHSYAFIFDEKLIFSKCNLPQVPNFIWQEQNFENENKLLQQLELHAKSLASLRHSQIKCLKKLNSEQNINQLFLLLETFRNSELEFLEYSKNYLQTLAKKYLFQKNELEFLQIYLATKQEIYLVLHQETIRALQSELEIWVFEKLYMAQLKNQFEFFKSLRKEVRKKFISELQ